MPGQISRLAGIIRDQGINIISMVVTSAKVMGLLKVILRVEVEDDTNITKVLSEAGLRVGEW